MRTIFTVCFIRCNETTLLLIDTGIYAIRKFRTKKTDMTPKKCFVSFNISGRITLEQGKD